MLTTITEAKCNACGTWSCIAPTGPYVVPWEDEDGEPCLGVVWGPWWWTDESGDPNEGPAGCPTCGAIWLVETELEDRVRPAFSDCPACPLCSAPSLTTIAESLEAGYLRCGCCGEDVLALPGEVAQALLADRLYAASEVEL